MPVQSETVKSFQISYDKTTIKGDLERKGYIYNNVFVNADKVNITVSMPYIEGAKYYTIYRKADYESVYRIRGTASEGIFYDYGDVGTYSYRYIAYDANDKRIFSSIVPGLVRVESGEEDSEALAELENVFKSMTEVEKITYVQALTGDLEMVAYVRGNKALLSTMYAYNEKYNSNVGYGAPKRGLVNPSVARIGGKLGKREYRRKARLAIAAIMVAKGELSFGNFSKKYFSEIWDRNVDLFKVCKEEIAESDAQRIMWRILTYVCIEKWKKAYFTSTLLKNTLQDFPPDMTFKGRTYVAGLIIKDADFRELIVTQIKKYSHK